jgi:glycosyltransferase involved in cell wall biosynthesis
MFCSTIIPTINRATLSRTIHSVLDQDFDAAECELIVVNDSGKPLPDMEWQHCQRVRVIDTNRHERSVARNTGAAIARGAYLHFLDDDDILLPGAMQAFWKLAQNAGDAAWIYGSYRTVDNAGKLVAEFHPGIQGNIFALLVSGEGIPFQVSLFKTKYFFETGGFDSNPVIIGVEDRDFGRRIALQHSVAYTPALVGEIRIGEQGSTTNWSKIAEGDRFGREKVLSLSRAFQRIRLSAETNYWRGRASRAYVASMVWNLQHHNFCIALSRMYNALRLANLHVFAPQFWNGLSTKIQ